jgi:transcriptional regulator with XRE-family HTH domain
VTGVREARETLGARLRELRRDAGLSGQGLADRCGWHPSKVSRLELGRQTPSEYDIREWCTATGADPHIPDLIASVRNINAAYLEWKRILSTGHARRQQQSITREAITQLMRWYEPEIVPGLLQTHRYAEAVLRACIDVVGGPNDLQAAVDARMERQTVLTTGVHRFSFLLAEQALYTTVGDDGVMAEQLTSLLRQWENPRVVLGVIPRSAVFRYPTTNFVIFDRSTVQVETIAAELTITQPRELALYERIFRTLTEQARYGDPARDLITAALALRTANR